MKSLTSEHFFHAGVNVRVNLIVGMLQIPDMRCLLRAHSRRTGICPLSGSCYFPGRTKKNTSHEGHINSNLDPSKPDEHQ
jgi:hypothetical protein